jgi:SAM-dependent methyltransferase
MWARLCLVLDLLKSLSQQRIFWSSADCVCCGSHVRRSFPVICNGLSQVWELTPELRRLLNLRDGTICASCRATARAMHLAAVLLDDIAKATGRRYETVQQLGQYGPDLRIAEINEIPGLHKNMVGMPGLTYSEYGGENSEDLMALTYRDESFDYVLTSDTLEHVPDFDRALAEVRRVLKAGGKHIFTIPLIWERTTRQRAAKIDGNVVHFLPPSHHGKASIQEYLVFNEFGGDVVQRIERAQFHVRIERDTSNPLVATFVCTKG